MERFFEMGIGIASILAGIAFAATVLLPSTMGISEGGQAPILAVIIILGFALLMIVGGATFIKMTARN